MKPQYKQDSTGIHKLIFDAAIWTQNEAAEFAAANGFAVTDITTNDGEILMLQSAADRFDPNGFGPGEQFREVDIAQGVSALVGVIPESPGLPDRQGTPEDLEEGQGPHPSEAQRCGPGRVYRNGRCVPRAMKTAGAESKSFGGLRESRAVFCKVDEDQRIVTGPALVPNVVDLQGDFELKEDIAEAAHLFLERFRGVDDMHKVFEGIGVPVESWLLRKDEEVSPGRVLAEGTWMLSIKVTNDDTWARVKSGELRGLSIVFFGMREGVHGD